jgi:hypothetical protein
MASERLNTTLLKKNMLVALEKNMGIVSISARQVGVHRATHYEWMKDDEHYRTAVQHLEGNQLDLAESVLLNQIREGNTTAVIFFLKTKGRVRGYVERTEITGVGEDNRIRIEIVDANPKN